MGEVYQSAEHRALGIYPKVFALFRCLHLTHENSCQLNRAKVR